MLRTTRQTFEDRFERVRIHKYVRLKHGLQLFAKPCIRTLNAYRSTMLQWLVKRIQYPGLS